jgi:hypothetical protein
VIAAAGLEKCKKGSARSRLQAARRVESAPSPMKKDPDHNSTDSAEIEGVLAAKAHDFCTELCIGL